MRLRDLLAAGDVDGFNAQRSQRTGPDLFAEDLSGLVLVGVDLGRANLEKADLSGTDLSDAIMAGARLDGADLTGARLRNLMAPRSRWREAWLGEADASGAVFTGADLTDAVLTGGRAPQAQFAGARLVRLEARGVDLGEADLAEARLTEADLREADLSGAVLREARAHKARLAGANLQRVQAASLVAPEADFTGASLRDADLSGADLSGADLSGADLGGARLARADLGGARLVGARLVGADLREARLADVDLSGADLQGALGLDRGDEAMPEVVAFEDLDLAWDGREVVLAWDNPEPSGGVRPRMARWRPGGAPPERMPVLPVPPDLLLARSVVAAGEGFVAAVFVDRPGGVTLDLFEVGPGGALRAGPSHRLGWRPLVRPLVTPDPAGGLRVHALVRPGPGILVQRVDGEGITTLVAEEARTARGFLGRDAPLVLTKGGTLVPVGGRGRPLPAPAGFPGRLAAGAFLGGGRAALAWAPRGERGFRWCLVTSRGVEAEGRVAPRAPVTGLDLLVLEGTPWAAFARDVDEDSGEPGGAFLLELDPGAAPRRLLPGQDEPVEDVRLAGVRGDAALIACQTLDERLVFVRVRGGRSRVVGVLAS